MTQFGRPDTPNDFPSWATEPIRSKISRHPTPGTPRADGRLVLPSDSLGRHMATRHACRIHYEADPRDRDCALTSTDLPEYLRITVSGVTWVGAGDPPDAYDSHVNGTWVMPVSQLAGFPCHWELSQYSPSPDDVTSYHSVLLWQEPSDGPGFARFRVFVSVSRFSGNFRTFDHHPFITEPIELDEDGKLDAAAQFPLALSPESPYDPFLSLWKFVDATVTVEIEGPVLPPPPPPPPVYTRSESVSIELQSAGVFTAHGWSGTTARGHNVYWRIKWRPSLPIAAKPGVEHLIIFYLAGIEVGRRVSEWPDDVLPWSVESGLSLAAAVGEIRTPPDTDPLESGDFFGFESQPTSDRWEWWNSHQLCPNFYESHPSGSVAIEARIQGFRFGEFQFVEGERGWQARWFEDLVNRRHILAPVLDSDGRWLLNTLVKIGEVIYDPSGGTPVAQSGLYYTYALMLVFGPTGLALSLHVRVFNDLAGVPPFWEPVPSVTATVFGLGPNHAGKILGVVPTDDLRLGDDVLYPIATRSMDQYELRDIVLSDKSPGPHPWLLDFSDCRVSLDLLTNRGDEPPAQGPLGADMKKPVRRVYVTGDGVTRYSHDGLIIPWGASPTDIGGWFRLAGDNYVTVPAGVTAIRVVGQAHGPDEQYGAAVSVWINGAPVITGQTFSYQDSAGSQIWCLQCELPYLQVSEGDKIQLRYGRFQGNNSGDVDLQWMYVEAIEREVFPLCRQIADYGEDLRWAVSPVRAGGDIHYIGTIPVVADGFKLRSVSASLLSAKSPVDDVTFQVSVLRAATRSVEDMLLNVLTIDADHYTSDTSVSPPAINPASAPVYTGDIVILTITDPGVGAEGLAISLEFDEPN